MISVASRTVARRCLPSAAARSNTNMMRSSQLFKQQQQQQGRFKSTLEADSGPLATHYYHHMQLVLAVLTPLYLVIPTSDDSWMHVIFGLGWAGTATAHSWIGMNYVATDYVPKVSKALLGPSRIVIGGMAGILFLGMSRIAISSPGGIKGVLLGVWKKPEKKE